MLHRSAPLRGDGEHVTPDHSSQGEIFVRRARPSARLDPCWTASTIGTKPTRPHVLKPFLAPSSSHRIGLLSRTFAKLFTTLEGTRGRGCASEEHSIRLTLEPIGGVKRLAFDLPRRELTVWHEAGKSAAIAKRLEPLAFGARLVRTEASPDAPSLPADDSRAQARALWALLAINGVMFVVELFAGIWFDSAGLLADSLDMFADAAVYALSLYAVGRTASARLRAARASGVLQLGLAAYAVVEVVRRFIAKSEPEPGWMIGVAGVALVANVACLFIISRHRKGGAHMKASYIFSTNDVLANLGVIGAGVAVASTGSGLPDLIAGAAIAILVLSGAVRILRLKQ